MNTFGRKLRLTTFGESHGKAMGGVLDGFPSGFKIDFKALQEEIDKRKPGNSGLVTQRKESDVPEFLSGINSEGITLGTPIGFIVRNQDHHSSDYNELENKFRPNHADYTYEVKYGIHDYRGGGRASARETLNWVISGALAQQWLAERDIKIYSLLTAAGGISYTEILTEKLSVNPFLNEKDFFVPKDVSSLLEEEVMKAKMDGDSVGGKISCLITGLQAGIGDPVFDKLHSRLAQAMMSINAAKGFEYGYGMASYQSKGSEFADIYINDEEEGVLTRTNYSGGIQGGISDGMPIFFNVSFKPTPTIMKELETVTKQGEKTVIKMKGRHDPCVALRAVPVVKAMAALVIADFLI